MASISFDNLKGDALESVENANLDIEVKQALKFISEGKTQLPREVKRLDLIKLVNFLLEEFDWKKVDIPMSSQGPSTSSLPNASAAGTSLTQSSDTNAGSASIVLSGDDVSKPKPKPEKVCHFYREGRCKFGGRGRNKEGACPDKHPRKCKNFMKKGVCQDGKKCDHLHPKLCTLPTKQGVCWKQGCTLAHVKQARSQNQRDHNRNYPQQASGQPQDSSNARSAKRVSNERTQENNNHNASFLGEQSHILSRLLDRLEKMELWEARLEKRMDSLEKSQTSRPWMN